MKLEGVGQRGDSTLVIELSFISKTQVDIRVNMSGVLIDVVFQMRDSFIYLVVSKEGEANVAVDLGDCFSV